MKCKNKAQLIQRLEQALEKVTLSNIGHSIPPQPTDVDLTLLDTIAYLKQPADIFLSNETHFGGMPNVSRFSISIDSVSISLSGDAYLAMVAAMDTRIADNLQKAQAVYEKYWAKVKQTSETIDAIRHLFYTECGDLFLRKNISEIDGSQLDALLESKNRLLDFE